MEKSKCHSCNDKNNKCKKTKKEKQFLICCSPGIQLPTGPSGLNTINGFVPFASGFRINVVGIGSDVGERLSTLGFGHNEDDSGQGNYLLFTNNTIVPVNSNIKNFAVYVKYRADSFTGMGSFEYEFKVKLKASNELSNISTYISTYIDLLEATFTVTKDDVLKEAYQDQLIIGPINVLNRKFVVVVVEGPMTVETQVSAYVETQVSAYVEGLINFLYNSQIVKLFENISNNYTYMF